ncbi:MAG TPA: class I SAM-dependent methyltransferase [Solirubrobacterales bacterium]|nr:class I SAM-dependent methyltransferase [Solirubrobacterales bacterium]
MSGLKQRLRGARRALLSRALERSGETSDRVSLSELGIERDGYHDYEPSGWLGLRRALRGIEVDRSQTFLDIGCGKGRIVAQAARRPFGRVLGVELSPELAAAARELLERERGRRRCGEVEIAVADVTTWEVPDDVTVAYVYNALGGEALTAMLDRIADSAARAPRRLLLLYANPINEETVLAHPAFELRERRGSRRWSPTDPRRISVFAVRA